MSEFYRDPPPLPPKRESNPVVGGAMATVAVVVAAAMVFGLILLIWSGVKVMHRHQQVADANNFVKTSQIKARNQTKLNEIRIGQQAQLVKVAQQQAQIRFENARGIREAQDEISQTLTPLYVQFEMVDALKEIAKSGKNSSVIYVPSGTNGIPLISGVAGQPSVGAPGSK